MLFTALVLVSIDREHYCLQEGVDLGHGYESTEVGDVSRLGLQQEKEIAIFLGLVIIGKEAFLNIGRIFEVAGDFILLLQCHTVLNQQRDSRVEVSHVLLENEILFRLRRYF
jgi:hypothetical protein